MTTKTKSSYPRLPQPSDDSAIEEEERRRQAAEQSARGVLDGRTLKRSRRQFQIGIKTSPESKKKFDRLRSLTGWSYSDIFEYAMDAATEKYEREHLK
jgi:hypothetical protein